MSATSAVLYATTLWGAIPLIPTTILLLFVFALLFAWGISDSASVALAMFALHVATLALLTVMAVMNIIRNSGGHMYDNWTAPIPDVTNLEGTGIMFAGSIICGLFFGNAPVDTHSRRGLGVLGEGVRVYLG